MARHGHANRRPGRGGVSKAFSCHVGVAAGDDPRRTALLPRVEGRGQCPSGGLGQYPGRGQPDHVHHVCGRPSRFQSTRCTGSLPRARGETSARAPPRAPETPHDTARTQIWAGLPRAGWRIRGPVGAAPLLGRKPFTFETRVKEDQAPASSLNGASPIRPVGESPISRTVPVGVSAEISRRNLI